MLPQEQNLINSLLGLKTTITNSSFWKNNWKWIVGVIVLLVLLLGAYGTGRYMQPLKEVTKEKVVYQDKIVEKVVYQDKIVDHTVYVKVQAKAIHKETITTKTPDGTVTTKVVEDAKVDTNVNKKDDHSKETQEVKTVEKVVYQDRTIEKIISPSKPNWRLGVLVGVDFITAFNPISNPQPIPQLGPVTLGIEAERRIVGPFSLGIWGTTSGQVGVLGNIEF